MNVEVDRFGGVFLRYGPVFLDESFETIVYRITDLHFRIFLLHCSRNFCFWYGLRNLTCQFYKTDFAFSDNCDLISCPLDCHLSFPDGEECPVCNCPLGQRCPHLNCPPEPMCLKVQRLDGCLNCACGKFSRVPADA